MPCGNNASSGRAPSLPAHPHEHDQQGGQRHDDRADADECLICRLSHRSLFFIEFALITTTSRTASRMSGTMNMTVRARDPETFGTVAFTALRRRQRENATGLG